MHLGIVNIDKYRKASIMLSGYIYSFNVIPAFKCLCVRLTFPVVENSAF